MAVTYGAGEEVTYPEHEKLAKIRDKSQAIGGFLEWCGEQGWQLATWIGDSACMSPIRMEGGPGTMKELLALYFDIDQAKLDAEKDAMLEAQIELNRKMDEARSGT